MTSLALLKQLKLAELREKHPNVPEHALAVPAYSDRTANGLTKCIKDWIMLHGGQAERINTTGIYRPGETVIDVIGRAREMKGKWTKGGATSGSADISATVRGRAWKIEVKIGRDTQSDEQKEYQADVERAGGIYSIVGSFEEFIIEWYKFNEIIKN